MKNEYIDLRDELLAALPERPTPQLSGVTCEASALLMICKRLNELTDTLERVAVALENLAPLADCVGDFPVGNRFLTSSAVEHF